MLRKGDKGMIYLLLFIEFFKTGLFTIGGGLATIPFLYEMSAKYPAWFSAADLADMIAVSESTPGPIGINMATYAGFNVAGVAGSIIATLALVLPSVIIIIIIAKFLNKFSENKFVKSAFYGLRPAVTALITIAGFQIFKISILSLDKYEISKKLYDIVNIKNLVIFMLLLFLIKKFNKHPIVYIAGAAVAGIIFKL